MLSWQSDGAAVTTAPVKIPDPPTIIVEAKLPSGFSGKAKLTVVQTIPPH